MIVSHLTMQADYRATNPNHKPNLSL